MQVKVCGDYISAQNTQIVGSQIYYRADETRLECPAVAPKYISEECKSVQELNCEEVSCPTKIVSKQRAVQLMARESSECGHIDISKIMLLNYNNKTNESHIVEGAILDQINSGILPQGYDISSLSWQVFSNSSPQYVCVVTLSGKTSRVIAQI